MTLNLFCSGFALWPVFSFVRSFFGKLFWKTTRDTQSQSLLDGLIDQTKKVDQFSLLSPSNLHAKRANASLSNGQDGKRDHKKKWKSFVRISRARENNHVLIESKSLMKLKLVLFILEQCFESFIEIPRLDKTFKSLVINVHLPSTSCEEFPNKDCFKLSLELNSLISFYLMVDFSRF